MSTQDTILVRAKPGKLLPPLHPPFRAETWIGWRLAKEGEAAEMVLPAGEGLWDRPERKMFHDGKEHRLPAVKTGRDIRLVRIMDGVRVPDEYLYRKAIMDGDLEQIEN